MAKSRNGMLGVGGQRKNISRKALRGQPGTGSSSTGDDRAALKKELLERMRARNAASETDRRADRDLERPESED